MLKNKLGFESKKLLEKGIFKVINMMLYGNI